MATHEMKDRGPNGKHGCKVCSPGPWVDPAGVAWHATETCPQCAIREQIQRAFLRFMQLVTNNEDLCVRPSWLPANDHIAYMASIYRVVESMRACTGHMVAMSETLKAHLQE